MNTEKLIKENKGTIVDVRTREEFAMGNAKDSVNIPLSEINRELERLKSFKQPLVLCCASGGRSAQASSYLSSYGIECYNAGSWMDVNFYLNN